MSRLRQHILSTYGAEAVKFVAAMVFGIIAARALEPAGRGLVAAAWTAVTVGVMLANLGVSKSLINRLNEPKPVLRPSDYYGGLLVMLPMMCVIAFIGFGVLVPALEGEERWLGYAVLSLAIPVQLATSMAQAVLRARRRIFLLNGIGAGASVLRLAALVVLWWMDQVTVVSVLSIETGYWVLQGLPAFAALRRPLLAKPAFAQTRMAVKSVLAYGIIFQIYSAMFGLQGQITTPILHYMAGDESTGYFAIAIRLAQSIGTLTNQLVFVFVPYMAQMRDFDSAREYSLRLARIGVAAVVPLSLVLWIIADRLIVLMYGSAFAPAVDPFRVIIPGTAAAALFQLLATAGTAKDNMKPLIVCCGGGLAVNLALTVALAPAFKELGAALAVSAGYAVTLILYVLFLRSRHQVAVRQIFLPSKSDLRAVYRRRAG